MTSCHLLAGMGTVEVKDDFYPTLAGTTLDLVFQRIDTCQSPTWPTQQRGPQMYLDFAVGEMENAVKFAESLGATQASDQPRERWRVMLDPAGNPFCLTHHRQRRCVAANGGMPECDHLVTPAFRLVATTRKVLRNCLVADLAYRWARRRMRGEARYGTWYRRSWLVPLPCAPATADEGVRLLMACNWRDNDSVDRSDDRMEAEPRQGALTCVNSTSSNATSFTNSSMTTTTA